LAFDLTLVKTIFVVLMENRSFDNLLGHWGGSQGPLGVIDGIKNDPAWLRQVANRYHETAFAPFPLDDPYGAMDADPPHERANIATQLGTLSHDVFPMSGFVENYASADGAKCLTKEKPPPVMGYFGKDEAPVTNFFAEQFAVCDRWFASLPAGTQPNRLMAMAGFSGIDVNHNLGIQDQQLVYDWLNQHGISWRVYHQGIPFFALMPRWIPHVVAGDSFRLFERFYYDVMEETPDEFPKVVFIEPTYTDAPHILPSSDDHAPSGIKGGQGFLFEVYRALTRSTDLWRSSVMIVTYDEHGGFFDHVSPPLVPTPAPQGAAYPPFQSLGVRVPALVISPFVEPMTVHKGRLDHTSILRFLGERFRGGSDYSEAVNARPVGSVSDVLNCPGGREARSIDSVTAYLAKDQSNGGFLPGAQPSTSMQSAFSQALDNIRKHPAAHDKFGVLLNTFEPRTPGE
jgi:phospholipase C